MDSGTLFDLYSTGLSYGIGLAILVVWFALGGFIGFTLVMNLFDKVKRVVFFVLLILYVPTILPLLHALRWFELLWF